MKHFIVVVLSVLALSVSAQTIAVHEGDMVSVSYHDQGGAMHAASVRITASAPKK